MDRYWHFSDVARRVNDVASSGKADVGTARWSLELGSGSGGNKSRRSPWSRIATRCDGGTRFDHPIPACTDTSVTFAPALDGAFNVMRYAAMGTELVPSVMN